MIAKAFSILAISAFGFTLAGDKTDITTIGLGTACPMADTKMKNIDNSEKSLSDIKKDNGLLVVFSCNTCPFVIGDGGESEGWETRYGGLHRFSENHKVGMVLVNSNHAKRDNGDGLTEMERRAKSKNWTMPYLLDEESALANAFGAKTTPHVFLFDKNMKLVYRGAIDDNVKSAREVKEKYLEDAITAMSAGKTIKVNETKPMGCSIKRKA